MTEKKINMLQEITAIFLVCITIFIFLSLLSYNPNDPSSRRHTTVPQTRVSNSMGTIGAHLSDKLVQTFGASSYVITMLFLIFGIAVIRNSAIKDCIIIFMGGITLLISLSAFISLTFGDTDPIFGKGIKAGGLLGGSISNKFLIEYFNRPGGFVVAGSAIILSLIATTNFSLLTALIRLVALIINIFRIFIQAAQGAVIRFLSWRQNKRLCKTGGERRKGKDSPFDLLGKKSGLKKGKYKHKQKDSADIENDGGYKLPPLSLLSSPPRSFSSKKAEEAILNNSQILMKKLNDFGIEGRVVEVISGPIVTRYEFEPASGIKVSKIMNLSDDLAMGMRAISIRILAPVPGKPVVGIEIPNVQRDTIYLKDILSSEVYKKSFRSKLTIGLGKNISGEPAVSDLSTIPHLLIAGATGSGKSVGVNCMILSILFNATPDEVKFLMIDPKMIELSIYEGIPHLIAPVITDPKKASVALKWVVNEMEKRYGLLAEKGVKNIVNYNRSIKNSRGLQQEREHEYIGSPDKEPKRLPYIVVVIDELADLMMVSSRDVEVSLMRLAQMARAAGIHLLIATQRPSVDVLTGVIKANFPARVSFQVTSKVDSRTILDSIGAERLLGKGDSLFLPPTSSRLERIHGALVSEEEVKEVVDFIKTQRKPSYIENVLTFTPTEETENRESKENDHDEKYDEAVALVARTRQASISMIQRRLRIGYNRAARIIEIMEKEGVIGPSDGVKPRQVYVNEI